MTQYIEEASRKTPVAGHYEVIVVGGGTSGVTAAIACARQGIDTLIVEQFGYLGGSQTAALVMPMMPITAQGTSSVGGINDEIRERLMATGDAGMEPGGNDGWFNREMLKYVLDDLCLEAGVEILYHTTLADVVMEGDQVCGIVVQCKSGRQAILARRVIDATADADVSVLAGAPYEAGRPEDGLNQAMSLRFNMGGIDYDRFVAFLNEKSPDRKYFWPFVETAHTPDKERPLSYLFRQAEAAGELQEGDAVYFQMFSIPGRPGEASFNCPRIFDRVKGYSTDDLTYAQIVGRQKIRRLANFCKKYFPGFENAFISQTAPMVGVRETRRIVGEYVFSGEDVTRAAQFPDAIAKGNYPKDVHQPKGKKSVEFDEEGRRPYYEIPYRCLIPKGVDNLLVVGRCISTTFEGQSAMRVQGIVRTIGEAAGYAMAISIQDNVSPRRVDVEKVRALLRASGVQL
jgi:hypothetical protein